MLPCAHPRAIATHWYGLGLGRVPGEGGGVRPPLATWTAQLGIVDVMELLLGQRVGITRDAKYGTDLLKGLSLGWVCYAG